MVVENDVMELQTGVRICVCSVRIFESSLHEGGSAVLASQLDLYFDVVHHAVVHLHQWQKRAICSLNALRALIGEELRCQLQGIQGNRHVFSS